MSTSYSIDPAEYERVMGHPKPEQKKWSSYDYTDGEPEKIDLTEVQKLALQMRVDYRVDQVTREAKQAGELMTLPELCAYAKDFPITAETKDRFEKATEELRMVEVRRSRAERRGEID